MKFSRESSGGTVGLFHALLLEQVNRLFGAAVDRVMKRHVGEAKFIVGLDRDGDLFDGAGAVVVSGTRDDDVRRIGLARLDEEIIRQADGLSLIERGDVVHAVLLHLNRALVNVAFAAGEVNLLVVVEDQHAVAQRPVRFDFQISLRAFDRAQIAAALFHDILQVRPRRDSGTSREHFSRRGDPARGY